MQKLKQQIENLQFKINLISKGYVFGIQLMNYHELNAILIGGSGGIKIVLQIIQLLYNNFFLSDNYINNIINFSNREIIFYLKNLSSKKNILTTEAFTYFIAQDKIFFVVPIADKVLAHKFARIIHSISQFYITIDPQLYLNCQIASLQFPNISNNAKDIFYLLSWLLSYNDQLYYRDYEDIDYNINNIKFLNTDINKVRHAVLHGKAVFAYQPIINIKNMKPYYYECLLRIPIGNNFVSIGPLIKTIERQGLIFLIDQMVLRMAVIELANCSNLVLSVNISNVGTLDLFLLDFAESLFKEYNVFDRLIIEITESTINQNYDKTSYFMMQLKKFGCKFALDDFGTGFASFTQLKNLPFDFIKIAGEYVRYIATNKACYDFIKTVVNISKHSGFLIVAEFVDNAKTVDCLLELKVDAMQGNFFSPAKLKRSL